MNIPRPYGRAFTLVELLVSMVLLTVVSLMLVSMTNSTASTWRYTTAKIEQFRGASDAFEAITRRLSQATLNTAWDYHYPGDDTTMQPDRYVRQSDLRFIAGKTESLLGSNSPRRPTHSIFFQAPLGFVDEQANFGGLVNLMNTWGYYVEFSKEIRPAFIDTLPNPPAARYRYRLMELMQPSNKLTIYSKTSGIPTYSGHEWFADSINATPPSVHVLAENVIALVLLPKLSKLEDPSGIKLAPNYAYDSTTSNTADPALDPKNQLPPIVQITMVAIDDVSAVRVSNGATTPSFDALLDTVFRSAKDYESDLATLQMALTQRKVNYRVFTSNVSIRGAKWSTK